MKKYLIITFFWSRLCLAQQTDYDVIVQPLDIKARDFSEYLVQLAWLNSPEGIAAKETVKNAEDEAKNTSKEWMRDVQGTFNLNEANLRSQNTEDGSVFFPRYNFGLNLNLFNIVSQGKKNKISKREITIAEQQENKKKLEIRADALTRYAEYKLAREIVKIRTLAEQEANANYILIQQLYKSDEKTFEDYTTAAATYYTAQETRLKAETEALITKLKLEEIIGLKWEQIQHPAKEE